MIALCYNICFAKQINTLRHSRRQMRYYVSFYFLNLLLSLIETLEYKKCQLKHFVSLLDSGIVVETKLTTPNNWLSDWKLLLFSCVGIHCFTLVSWWGNNWVQRKIVHCNSNLCFFFSLHWYSLKKITNQMNGACMLFSAQKSMCC